MDMGLLLPMAELHPEQQIPSDSICFRHRRGIRVIRQKYFKLQGMWLGGYSVLRMGRWVALSIRVLQLGEQACSTEASLVPLASHTGPGILLAICTCAVK